MDHMDHELLMRDMVTGYHTYAEAAELDITATTEAPAIPGTPETPQTPKTPGIVKAVVPGLPQLNHWEAAYFAAFGGFFSKPNRDYGWARK